VGTVESATPTEVTVSFYASPGGGSHRIELPYLDGTTYAANDRAVIIFQTQNPESGIAIGKLA